MTAFWIIWILLGAALAAAIDYRASRQPVPYGSWPSGISLTHIRIALYLVSIAFCPILLGRSAKLIITRMVRKEKVNLERVKASLTTLCPKCGYEIPPEKVSRISFDEMICPQCSARFVPARKSR